MSVFLCTSVLQRSTLKLQKKDRILWLSFLRKFNSHCLPTYVSCYLGYLRLSLPQVESSGHFFFCLRLANFRPCFRLGKLTFNYYHNLNFCNTPGASLIANRNQLQDFPPFYRRLE